MILTGQNKWLFIVYYSAGVILLSVIIYWSYFRLGLLNTNIVLGGWDAPFYLWQAETVLRNGPIYFMNRITYPMLYPQLLAGLGTLVGNLLLVARVLPEVMGATLLGMYSFFSYKISRNIHVAGLTAILTAVSPAFIWIVGEYHRTNLALVFAWAAFVLVIDGDWPNSGRKQLVMLLLFFLAAFTEFEVFAVMGLTLLLFSVVKRNKKSFILFGVFSLLPIVSLLLMFPQFYSVHYLNLESESYVIQRPWIYQDLAFWGLGSVGLLPLALLGCYPIARGINRAASPERILLTLFSLILVVPALAVSQTTLNGLGIRAILVIPTPLFLASGISYSTSWIARHSRKSLSTNIGGFFSVLGRIDRRRLLGVSLSALVVFSLVVSTVAATDIEMVPFYKTSAISKIQLVGQYLNANALAVPVFAFAGSSLWSADEYRAYIGSEIGDHLAYFGDISNLVEFRPTLSHLAYPAGNIANFTSVKFLRDLLGDRGYLIYFQSESVRTLADLLKRPLVILAPELYDAPVPFYALPFAIGDGTYVIPSLKLVADQISPSMTLQSQRGVETIDGYVNGSTVTLNFGTGSSWYRLTGFTNNFVLSELAQGGAKSFPENAPRRPNGDPAAFGNDVSENVQYWQVPEATFTVDNSNMKEGAGSLSIIGRTDAWGNVWATYTPPFQMNLSGYDTLSFWGSLNLGNAQWVVVLRDSSGAQASYWNVIHGQVAPTEVKRGFNKCRRRS